MISRSSRPVSMVAAGLGPYAIDLLRQWRNVRVVWDPKKHMTQIRDLTLAQFARAIPARVRRRLLSGRFDSGEDVAMLRRFVGLSQTKFARAMGISVHTLRNWEQGRRHPDGPAIALLRIAARHPRIIRENMNSAA